MRLFDLGGDGTEEAHNRVFTVPNLMSVARLCILPFLYLDLADGRFGRALVIGWIFGATDFLDGYVARRFDQVTRLGQLLDPISDRFFIGTIGIGAAVSGLLPWWPIVAIIARDAVFLVVGLVLMGRGVSPPPVTRLGKSATFGLMWSFVPLLAAGIVGSAEDPEPVFWWIGMTGMAVAVALYYLVAVQYARIVFGADRSSDVPA